MKVLLRLKEVKDQVVAQLARAHCGVPKADHGAEQLYLFINLKSIQFDSNNEAQVDLQLDTEFVPSEELMREPRDQRKVKVTREMLDPLWDLLDVFPRKKQSQTTLGEVREPLWFILKNLEAIHDAARKKVVYGKPGSLIFSEISELARTAILRVAMLQLVE